MTLVSVVIPTYNRPQLLMTRSLPSVMAQTHEELDIHVVGDGTDAASFELAPGSHVSVVNVHGSIMVEGWNIQPKRIPVV